MTQTKSESLFERYLEEHDYTDWEREPVGLAGQTKRPDCLLRFRGLELLLEVKEMCKKRPLPEGCVHFDPYAGLRSEIDEALQTRHDTFVSIPNSRFNVVRVWVCENPFAEHPLPEDVFSGGFDMRWKYNLASEEIERVFAGPRLTAMEDADPEEDIDIECW